MSARDDYPNLADLVSHGYVTAVGHNRARTEGRDALDEIDRLRAMAAELEAVKQ